MHAPDVQSLVERLAALGLTREEAALYVHLTMHGASKAGDLAAVLGYPRPKAYRLLSDLMHRGFVAATLSRPTVFEASPPDRLFAGLLTSVQARAEVLAAAQVELEPQLSALRGARDAEPGRVTYKILQGRAETAGVGEGMLRDARDTILLFDATTASSFQPVREWAFERAARGVRLRVLAAGPFPRVKLESWTSLSTVRLRQTPPAGARFVVVDGQALLWLAHDASADAEGPRDAALWTDSPDLLGTLVALFDAAWERGAPPTPDVTDHDLSVLGLAVRDPAT